MTTEKIKKRKELNKKSNPLTLTTLGGTYGSVCQYPNNSKDRDSLNCDTTRGFVLPFTTLYGFSPAYNCANTYIKKAILVIISFSYKIFFQTKQ